MFVVAAKIINSYKSNLGMYLIRYYENKITQIRQQSITEYCLHCHSLENQVNDDKSQNQPEFLDKQITMDLGKIFEAAKRDVDNNNEPTNLSRLKSINAMQEQCQAQQKLFKQKCKENIISLNNTIKVLLGDIHHLELKLQRNKNDTNQILNEFKKVKSNQDKQIELRLQILKRKSNEMSPEKLLKLLNDQWSQFQQMFKDVKDTKIKKQSQQQLDSMKLLIDSFSKLIHLSNDTIFQQPSIYDNYHRPFLRSYFGV